MNTVLYEDVNPYNRAFSYSIFLISAILMLIIQQVMFYGMGMSVGTMREENRSFASLPDTLTGRGVGRVVLGRGAVYWLLFMIIGIYVCCVVPAMFGFPQRGRFQDFQLADNGLSGFLEVVLLSVPVHLRLPGFHQPEHGRCSASGRRSAAPRPVYPGSRLLHPCLRSGICGEFRSQEVRDGLFGLF